jgi:hypothetical protein
MQASPGGSASAPAASSILQPTPSIKELKVAGYTMDWAWLYFRNGCKARGLSRQPVDHVWWWFATGLGTDGAQAVPGASSSYLVRRGIGPEAAGSGSGAPAHRRPPPPPPRPDARRALAPRPVGAAAPQRHLLQRPAPRVD